MQPSRRTRLVIRARPRATKRTRLHAMDTPTPITVKYMFGPPGTKRTDWRTVPAHPALVAGVSWEIVRFLIEDENHMHDERRKKSSQCSCVAGFHHSAVGTKLGFSGVAKIDPKERFSHKTYVVLQRIPVPMGEIGMVPLGMVPRRLAAAAKNDAGTYGVSGQTYGGGGGGGGGPACTTVTGREDTEMDVHAVLARDATVWANNNHAPAEGDFHFNRKATRHHADAPASDAPECFVRPDYVCHQCGARGQHMGQACPTRREGELKIRYDKPMGIPYADLELVDIEDERQRAKLIADGTAVFVCESGEARILGSGKDMLFRRAMR
jgi:hypothetical protein